MLHHETLTYSTRELHEEMNANSRSKKKVPKLSIFYKRWESYSSSSHENEDYSCSSFRQRKVINTSVPWERPLRVHSVDGLNLLSNKFRRAAERPMPRCVPVLTSADAGSLMWSPSWPVQMQAHCYRCLLLQGSGRNLRDNEHKT